LDFDGIVAGWDIEEKEKIAKKERKYAPSPSAVPENTIIAHQSRQIASNCEVCIN
jgi:hypothetical protein